MSFDLPSLPQGWSYVPLEQLAQKNSVTYGVVQPGTHVEHGVPIVRVNNFKEGRVELSELMRIDPEIEKKYGRTRLQGGEVLLTVVGSVGQVAVVSEALKGFNVARAVAVIHPQQQVDPNWLALCLRSPLSQHLLGSRANTTVQTTINLKDLRALPVPVAPEYERGKIIELIGSLDDRITLLRETNVTLEAIAQALFKSWFVDFNPVRAKAEGLEPEGMDAAIAVLFPDSFEGSELGLAPKGWATRPIYEMASYINGAAYKAFEPNAERRGLPIIKIAELKAGVTSQTAFSDIVMPDKYLIRTGDILFSWSGNPDTSIDTFVWGHDPALLNQHIFRVLPHASNERSFVLQTLRNLRPIFAELARNKQTTGLGHVTVADLKRLHVINPPGSVIEQFNNFAETIHQMIFGNEQQAQTLTQLRDTLLPRLISGQLRLPEAEVTVEEFCA
ncbi:restriction endonuclease subunit S [Pseudomonas sp. GL-R-19]|uniref:restriction endonuclease subunit S n=1 Tax=Pseudomonas sp. GL-R-19 TaxID=2832391 RepID=UPI001CC155F4|nr:restriction endonuclease subunit S [Pseudomonas sp. GL-R-19]